jgi:O-methyltransferase
MQRFGFTGRPALELAVSLHCACQSAAPAPLLPVPLLDINDPDFDEVLSQSWPYSMSSVYGLVDAFYSLYLMVQYVVKYRIPGDFVECGVYAGGMSLLAALSFIKAGDTSRNIYLYDTYEGMPPPTAEDSEAARIAYDNNTRDGKKWASKSLEEVREVINLSGYPQEKIHLVKGLVEDTIPNQAPEKISILRLDTDFYSSTLHELNHLYPRLSSGGGLVIDDYGYMVGSRQAVDEYFATSDRPILLNRINYMVRVGTKP